MLGGGMGVAGGDGEGGLVGDEEVVFPRYVQVGW